MIAPVAPGDVILGKYRVERILGQGGMGVVVAARHIELGELFAIKFLLPQALEQPQAVERFIREARASARLKGEHVAKVHDVGRLPDGLPYMVLEHLSGNDLKHTVRERGPLPVAEAVTYLLQACEAIAEAHDHGIVHRDIKPANLFLVRRPNGTPCVKVLDFGISKQAEPESAEQHGLTTTGMLLGSPFYMSPEQMLRTKEADALSDIWSLGCVLYELLTGRVPFRAEALTELVGKVLQEEPLPPSACRGDIPPAVDAVVMRCLAKRKELRFQSVQELGQALQSALWPMAQPGPLPVPVPRPSAPSHHGHDTVIPFPASGSAAAPAGPAPIANTTPGWGTISSEANRASPKGRAGLIVGVVVGLGVLVAGVGWLALRPAPPAPKEGTEIFAQAATPSSAAAPSAPVSEAPSVAAPPPEPSATPAAAASAAEVPAAPDPRPTPTSKPLAPPRPNPGPAVSHAPAPPPPTAKPTAEPTAAPSGKKRGTMY